MVMARKNFAVLDDDGTVVDGASIEVRREIPGAPLAALKSDRAGTVAMANPFTAADGSDAGFYVAGGFYKITATKAGFSKTWRYEPAGLAQGADEMDSLALIVNGDSTSYDGSGGLGTWAQHLRAVCAYFGRGEVFNLSVPGDTSEDMMDRYDADFADVSLAQFSEKISLERIGYNDAVSSISAATTYANKVAYWAAQRALGCKVGTFLLTHRDDASGPQNAVHDAVNVLVLSDPTLYDWVFPANEWFTDTSDTSIFVDGVHFSEAANLTTAYRVGEIILGVNQDSVPADISNVGGLGTGVATALAANIGSAGAVVVFNGAGGTPSSINLANASGINVTTNVGGMGAGVGTALSIAVGSAGGPVVNGGALGTPSSGDGSNITNVNAATLGGATFAAPGAIGGTTAAAGSFTTLSGSTSVTSPIYASSAGMTVKVNGTTVAGAISTGGNWALGTQSPVASLTPLLDVNQTSAGTAMADTVAPGIRVLQSGAAANVVLQSYGTNGNILSGFAAGGTSGAVTTLTSGTIIVALRGLGWDTAAWGNAGAANVLISCRAAQDQAVGAHGTEIVFATTPNGSATRANAMLVHNSAGVTVGSSHTDPGAGNLSISGGLVPGSFTVATLPSGVTGKTVWASDCRVFNGTGTQEGAGVGTGGLVTYNGSAWKIAGTNVTAVA